MKIKIAIESLGCRVNKNESERLLVNFSNEKYEEVSFKEYADIYIIHTCTVTNKADSKSKSLIKKAKSQNKNSLIVMTGCYAQTSPNDIFKISEVDLVVGIKNRNNLYKLIENFTSRKIITSDIKKEKIFKSLPFICPTNKTRFFIKIQEGCNKFCSYCAIPNARGPSRSNKIKEILNEIKKSVNFGFKEIILTGTHIGAYGKDFKNRISLVDLINEILLIDKLKRIRFGSLDPNEIDDNFIKIFKNNKILPHLHISLQSGDDDILKKMNRSYNTKFYEDIVNKLRNIKNDLSITTDIIVGFPSETEENHKNSINFIKKINIDNLHIFKYSAKNGTKASYLKNQIPEYVKNKRSKDMICIRKDLHNIFLNKMINKKTKVLIESNKNNYFLGYTENYLKIFIKDKNLKKNNIYLVSIKSKKDDNLIGVLNKE